MSTCPFQTVDCGPGISGRATTSSRNYSSTRSGSANAGGPNPSWIARAGR